MQPIVFESPRLIVRLMRSGDQTRLYHLLSHPEVMEHSATGVLSAEQVRQLIERNCASYTRVGYGIWAVCEKKTGRVIGMAGLYTQSLEGPTEYEIVYKLSQKYWGQGYGTELVRHLLAYCFTAAHVHHVVAAISHANLASLRVAEKVGMHCEKDTFYQRIPIYIYGITRDAIAPLETLQAKSTLGERIAFAQEGADHA